MINPLFNFAGRDFTAQFQRTLELLQQELPEYTDWNHSDAGIALLRIADRESDMGNDYLDRAFQEGFLEGCVFKQSAIDLGKLVGYLPKIGASATSRATITIGIDATTPTYNVPAFTRVRRSDNVQYLTMNSVIASATPVEVDLIQGEVVTLTLTENDFDDFEWSDRVYYNLGKGVAARSVEVTHGYPIHVWSEVETFAESSATDLHFWIELNGEDDSVFLVLGNGNKGAGFPAGETMTVKFIRCVGPTGNCGSGVIKYLSDYDYEYFTVVNNIPATGGAYPETLADIKNRIPEVVTLQRRAVTRNDYKTLIEYMPGMKHCQAVDRNQSREWPHLHIRLFMVPEGGGGMSPYMLSLVYDKLAERGTYGEWHERYIVSDAIALPVSITIRLGINRGFNNASVVASVQAAITSFFSVNNIKIGENISFAALHRLISSVEGVSWVEFESPESDVTVGIGYYPVIGNVNITVTQ